MKLLINPSAEMLTEALKRPKLEGVQLEETVRAVFQQVEQNGDQALRMFTEQFDGVKLDTLKVSDAEIIEAENSLPETLKNAIQMAARNIEQFHTSQQESEQMIETTPGVTCWRKSVPVQSVGLYVPGGTAPLFSTVLMLGIPAKIAACPTRILCTPPAKDGSVHPAILFAASVAGITEIYKVGGSQAIAAMSLGTESIPKVDKLFGPGNQYVTAAKQYAQQLGIAIDLPAGPSEVLVAADDSVPAAFIAADLLAQAEHGADSQVVLLSDSESFVTLIQQELAQQLAQLPRAEIAKQALENSVAIVVDFSKWAEIINQYAPEHLILMGKYERLVVEQVVNAGSVFLGQFTAESFGDYASGTNHTLPTAGFARAYSGVSLDSFVKKITYQRVSETGLQNLGNTVIELAKAEQLDAHANAVEVRLAAQINQIQKQ
ncbi:MAG: histidinol dehydrogenase [Candidatus Fluviicola riflensis]|nr:MAG: histidinol dehydrogenase [Candidatus Fluviicola riflensis]OGS79672.1 MAG: histidinol dehydrogenase [Candidatus Fluviicola riflensis]OGS87104.1 MAG: histidinol dehydrogenase [Fluviicola sp. RIFCSPHIGHO2_01_FULL_43_53]OGS89893.1 MAG: histidinol dehydrogenase [Fluviicola sp. RIFCSPHIGHO2_12_FULL_43_24]